MHRKLTVKENIRFSAFTRLPVEMSTAEKTALINDVIQVFLLKTL